MSKTNILVLDDDPIVRTYLNTGLSKDYNLNLFSSPKEAINFLKSNKVDIALLDIDLGETLTGIDALKEMVKIIPDLPIIMISTLTDIDTVVDCMKGGALDYIEKPIDIPKLKFRINKILELKEMRIISERYKKIKETQSARDAIIGNHSKINACKEMIKNAGPMRILILGETGVGKTPFAKYSNTLLSHETEKDRPFEQINCACLKRERFIDELFGHVKGAYTGAISDKKGLVEIAQGGDLFLDEIGDLDLECQAELLTFLDHYEYYKLGGTKKLKSKIRIISATNKDLKKMIEEGTFRKDLYSRIAQCVIEIPPLRERRDDIEPLVNFFIKHFTGFEKTIDSQTINQLKRFDWEEGNVRDLKNVCEYISIISRNSDSINNSHLPESYKNVSSSVDDIDLSNQIDISPVFEVGYEEFLEKIEYAICKKLLAKETKVKKLSELVQLNRMTLNRKLVKLNLK